MVTAFSDETLALNGFRMHYLDWGNPGAPPLLMVHGLTRQAHAFDGVADRLRERFHCMAIDVRGRGESGWTGAETYNYEQYAADVEAFLAAQGLEQTHYMGTSMGGIIGMHLAVEQPRRFLSFVINDIGPELAPAGATRIQVDETPAPGPELGSHAFPRLSWLSSSCSGFGSSAQLSSGRRIPSQSPSRLS